MVDLTEELKQLEIDTKRWRRGRRGAPGQAFEGARPSSRSKKTGGTEENRRRDREFDKLNLEPLFALFGQSGTGDRLKKRPSLTDFDRQFSNALDKKLEADPGQITDEFLRTMYSNYRQKIEEGIATQEGYNRLQNVIFKYADITPSSMEDMPPKITHKYLGTKKGGRIKKRKNKIKKNYSKGGGVRTANY